ncbi:MAG: biopolymer transporter ExbD [Candidatus Schekmanbacteria bacterium]|nr:biopolymer transporter ExbD [Candidatus Schekmanbacteria bacterium]
MGMAVGRRSGPMADPNVIPFIDICLVLLIIFMIVVTILMAQLGYESKLPPQAQSDSPPPQGPVEQIVVRVAEPCQMGQFGTCKVFINQEDVPIMQFPERIKRVSEGRATQTMFFTAEDSVNYENAMKVLDMMRSAGIRNIGVLADPVPVQMGEGTVDAPPVP